MTYPREMLLKIKERIDSGGEPWGIAHFDFKLKRDGSLGEFRGYRYQDNKEAHVREVLNSELFRRYGGFFSPRNIDLFRRIMPHVGIGARNCKIIPVCHTLCFNLSHVMNHSDNTRATLNYLVSDYDDEAPA